MEKFDYILDCISDTHNQHKNIVLPGGDFLIHAGDATMGGRLTELMPFLDWLAKQPYENKIFVPGNHDWACEEGPALVADECKRRDIFLLNDSGIKLEGINFWGSPVQPEFCDWAFNRKRGEEIRRHWDLIPEDTQVLITHGPPYNIKDATYHGEKVGCQDLFLKLMQTKTKLHVFGHIHEARGYQYWDERVFVNASSVDARYVLQKPGYVRVIKVENDFFVEPSHPNIPPEE